MRIGSTWGAALFLFAVGAEAGSGGSVYWTERSHETKGIFLFRDVPDGEPARLAPLPRVGMTLRPGPGGTLLGWDPQGIFASTLDGATAWEIPADRIAGGEVTTGRSVDIAANGNLVLYGTSRKEGRRQEEAIRKIREEAAASPEERLAVAGRLKALMRGGRVAAEIDREGKLVRLLPVPGDVMSVRPAGDRLLWVFPDRVAEVGWDGKEIASVPLEEGTRGFDAVKLPSGGYVVIADAGARARKQGKTGKAGKAGLVAEFDPSGKRLWEGSHDCPRSLQLLPDGGVLVGAG